MLDTQPTITTATSTILATPTAPALDYYAQHGMITVPREHAHLLDALPTEIDALCSILQSLIIHPMEAYLYNERLSPMRKQEVNIRSVSRMLTRLMEIDDQPLTIARPPRFRLVGNCRHFATLFCAFLRHKGIPARARCGFAVYFNNSDHWVCEYWKATEGRWVLIDPQLDDIQLNAYSIPFDPHDMPRDCFLVAGEAWQQCNLEGVDARRYGFRRWRGKNFIASSILRDLAALNKVEVLPWDLGDAIAGGKRVQELSTTELAQLDNYADLSIELISNDDVLPQVRAAYERDRRLHEAVEVLVDEEKEKYDHHKHHPVSFVAPLQEPVVHVKHKRPRPAARQRATNLEPDKILVRGAQQHNLKNIDVSIPRYKFVVLTGASGSGKSSLAFDTIYAEGQRRYVESLSPYVRGALSSN